MPAQIANIRVNTFYEMPYIHGYISVPDGHVRIDASTSGVWLEIDLPKIMMEHYAARRPIAVQWAQSSAVRALLLRSDVR